MKNYLSKFSITYPKTVVTIVLVVALLTGIQFPNIKIDTDPENMLSEHELVRVFHNSVKKDFSLHDFLILGIINEVDPNGVFNPGTLKKVYDITTAIKKIKGVITYDLISPSTTDNIRQGGLGTVKFEWLMGSPPETQEKALEIREDAKNNPMLNGTLISEDGKALALYIPIESKDITYRVSHEIRDITDKFTGDDQYHITGLPVAEDTFGVEMFKQMAISAPLAGLVIFLLMLYFFKKPMLILSPMLVALLSIIYAMGTMIGMGYTVHIMSSMIPIFLMPISVVDAVHILSQFFDKYPKIGNKQETLLDVMSELFKPMLFTTLTTIAGFASLAFTPIPPVRIFGIFIAFGVTAAWFLTMTLVPAFIMLMKEESFKNFGTVDTEKDTPFSLRLNALGRFSAEKWKAILLTAVAVLVVSGVGISKIVINDNPVKWFESDHPIREADRILNKHFGGTYTAYLILETKKNEAEFTKDVENILKKLDIFAADEGLEGSVKKVAKDFMISTEAKLIASKQYSITALVNEGLNFAESKDDDRWYLVMDFFDNEKIAAQTFKQPAVLRYIEDLQSSLLSSDKVGKSISLADIVKKVHYELRGGDKTFNVIPKSSFAIGQVLVSFQNSHDPDDLWHFVTPDYGKANIWVQLTSGDNKDMAAVVELVNKYVENNPPPENIKLGWAGLTYLNVVWQDKMVTGMLESLLGSFVIVFIMMVVLNRSFLWGVLAMVPLSLTIICIYGIIGFIGKDYDMPIAVLSSLTLGLSIDFAIHFLETLRSLYKETGSLEKSISVLFNEPARAITRNAIIVAFGFLPLLAATLIPYKTVGFFMFSIMAVSGAATLIVLPSMVVGLSKFLFAAEARGK